MWSEKLGWTISAVVTGAIVGYVAWLVPFVAIVFYLFVAPWVVLGVLKKWEAGNV